MSGGRNLFFFSNDLDSHDSPENVPKKSMVHREPKITGSISMKDYNHGFYLIPVSFYYSIIMSPLVVVNEIQIYWSKDLVYKQYKTVWYWDILEEPL